MLATITFQKKLKTKITCCCKLQNNKGNVRYSRDNPKGIKIWNNWFWCTWLKGCETENWWSTEAKCREKGFIE